jgi:hypothetical protein
MHQDLLEYVSSQMTLEAIMNAEMERIMSRRGQKRSEKVFLRDLRYQPSLVEGRGLKGAERFADRDQSPCNEGE